MSTNPNLDGINNENVFTSFTNVNNNSEFHSFFSPQDSSSHHNNALNVSLSSSSSDDVYSEAEDDVVEEEFSEDEECVDSDEEQQRINYYRRAKRQSPTVQGSLALTRRGRKPRAPGEPPRPRGPPRGPRGPYKPRKPKDPSMISINYRQAMPHVLPYTQMHPALAGFPSQAILIPMPGPNGVPVMVPYLPASMVMPHLAAPHSTTSEPSSSLSRESQAPMYPIPIITTPSGMMVSSTTGQLIPPIKQEEERKQEPPLPSSPRLNEISVDDHVPSLVKDRARRTKVRSLDYSTFDRIKEENIRKEEEVSQSTHVPVSLLPKEETDEDENEEEELSETTPFVEKILTLSTNGNILSIEEAISHNDSNALITPGAEHPVDELRLLSVNHDLPKILEKLKSDDSSHGAKEKLKSPLLFLVKLSTRSYWHTEWVTSDLILAERGGNIRYHRIIGKAYSLPTFPPFFDENYLKIDRILDIFIEHEDDEKEVYEYPIPTPSLVEGRRSFLIKWKSMAADAASWEYEEVIIKRCPEMAPRLIEKFVDGLKPSELKIATSKMLVEAKNNNTPIPRPVYRQLSDEECEILWSGDRSLRPYQREGVDWLCFCWTQRQPCIIADEMGLGKTVQVAAFFARIASKDFGSIPGPFLVVAPLSCVPHWERELRAWAPQLSLLLYQGKAGERDALYEHEFWYRSEDEQKSPLKIPGITKFDILLTSYEMAMMGQYHLARVSFRIAIFDEAQRLKNKSSRMAEILGALRIEHKILLTGTPLQNSIEELFALLSFIQPWKFSDEAAFLAEYGRMEHPEDVAKIQALLRPLMLRRLKEDVERGIPLREETILEVELTPIQKRYYRAILERNLAYLAGSGGGSAGLSSLANAMMELRKVCMHPFLIEGAEDTLTAAATDYDYVLTHVSVKFLLVDKLLRKLRAERRRVLIFSQMTRMLDLLEHLMELRGYPFERIDGRIRGELRQAAIDRFCDETGDVFVFLLCTRAGGVGINLTAADTVIIYDSDWNPQNDLQAMARCHRIGQTRQVKVYRLICTATYEQVMLERAGRKLGLDRAILQCMPAADGIEKKPKEGFSRRDIEMLLRRGAYGAIMDEEATPLEDEDIDIILERRTRVVTHQEEEVKSSSSIFSKATFAASNSGDNFGVSEDDPNFWLLWARHVRGAEPGRPDGLQPLEEDERRLRRQLRRLPTTPLSSTEMLNVEEEKAPLTLEQSSDAKMGEAGHAVLQALLRLGLGRSKRIVTEMEERITAAFVSAMTRALFEEHILQLSLEDDKYLIPDSASLLLLISEEEVEIDEQTQLAASVEAKAVVEKVSTSCFKELMLRASLMRFLGRVIDRLFYDSSLKRKHLPGSQWLDQDISAALGFLGVTTASVVRSSTRTSRPAKSPKGEKKEKESLSSIAAALSALDWPPRSEERQGLPRWWGVPLHDIALLLSTWVHGLDQPLDVILGDRRFFVAEEGVDGVDRKSLNRRLFQLINYVIERIEISDVGSSSFDISIPETMSGKRGATRRVALPDGSKLADDDSYPSINEEEGDDETDVYQNDDVDDVVVKKRPKRERPPPARVASPRIRLRVSNK